MKHILVSALVSLVMLTGYHFLLPARTPAQNVDELQLSELRIVDGTGTVRVRLGGDLPDAVIDGKPLDRGGDAAGILLYDVTGHERSGYVTMVPGNNVMLTLDNLRTQTALFAAGPEGGSSLRLWHGENAAEVRVDGGGARFTVVEKGSAVYQRPITKLPDEACEAYRSASEELSPNAALDACTMRFLEEQCRACLTPAPGAVND